MRRSALVVGVMVSALVVGPVTAAYATPGDLDTTFDGDGIAYADFGLGSVGAEGVAIQSNNGKIVVAGYVIGATVDFAVARLNTDGSLDPNFGTGGLNTTNFGGADDYGNDVAIGLDGKIVVAGYRFDSGTVTQAFAVARYRRGGRLDRSFSGDGRVRTQVGAAGDDQGVAVAVQDDGKVVVGGWTYDAATGTDVDFALVRYNTDGSLDTTFDADGKVTTDFALENDAIVELAIQDDGKIVAVGHATEAGVLKASVARYNTDGTLDTTFSTDGKVASLVSSGGAYAEARAVAIQPDGKIVVGGGGEGSADEDFAVFRYNTDGTLDTTFAGDGKKNVDFGDWELAYSVAVQTDGRIVAAGYTVFAHDFALLRMEADGRLDSTYGVGGLVTVDLGGNESYMDAALQSDDKLVGVGLSSSVSTTAFAVGRHLAS